MSAAAFDTRKRPLGPAVKPTPAEKPLRALPAPEAPKAELAPPKNEPVLLTLRPDAALDTPAGSAIRRECEWP